MKKKIYLIEDDSAIIDIYETMMGKANFDVEVMSLGQDVMKKIKGIVSGQESRPDIVLLDLILPDMNGVDILREIRGNSATKDIKVFILSNQNKLDVPNSETAKPDKFIIKAHTTPTQLIETIKKELK